MESISSASMVGVQLPTFLMVSEDVFRLIEAAASAVTTSTEEFGEYFAMSLVQIVTAELLPAESIIVIPLSAPAEGGIFDLTSIATVQLMFIQVHDKPQPLRTYGRCVGYSTGTLDRPLELGAMVRFPTTAHFIMAKRNLATAVVRGRSIAPVVAETSPEKRQCVRPLGEVGEAADDTGVKTKDTSMYILDLDGIQYPTRNKTDIAIREKELSFLLRAMDLERREYSVTTDMALQTDVYRRLICEQGDTQAEDRISAFLSCGLINRVQRIQVFQKTEKLKLILTGCVLLEGSTEASFSLEDFSTGDKIAVRSTPCPNNNVGLIAALKNLQMVMQIIFSEFFETCLESFIQSLEGSFRPMELVAADFFKYSVSSSSSLER